MPDGVEQFQDGLIAQRQWRRWCHQRIKECEHLVNGQHIGQRSTDFRRLHLLGHILTDVPLLL